MTKDIGRSADADGLVGLRPEPSFAASLGHAAPIPSADDLAIEAGLIWLQLGRHFAAMIADPGDWVDDEKSADFAIAMARRACSCLDLAAQAIEARRAGTTQIGSVEDESAVPKECATPTPRGSK